ncbi:hypothetical protein LCGC14_1416200 [marine sediment metagenome]|uniref:Uncharacterized protein n=1 Tax=marine sediment metagenome TaxID=412755 RepID=A0A0F9KDZ5_9ZZZZ
MARVRGSDFGETVLAVRADDSELKATLAKDEAFVRTSTAKMQGSLNKLNVPMKSLGASSITVGGTFAVLGAAVSTFGGTAGAAVGPVVALTGAVSALGLRVTALAAIFALVGGIIFTQELADLIEGVDAAAAELAIKEAKLQAILDARKAREKAAADLLAKQITLLRQEILILQGRAKQTDFIIDKEKRLLTVLRDKLAIEKSIADAQRAAIRAQGPQTPLEALLDIQQALRLEEARETGVENFRQLSRELLRIGELTEKKFKFLEEKFFPVSTVEKVDKPEPIDIGGGLGIPATRFTDVAAFAGGLGDPAAKRDAIRKKQLDTIILLQRQGVRLN